jgi:16S rRNA (cytosine1402-N4)-methyltransferase
MHIPVLLQETIDGLQIIKGGTYVDCTTNRGGHSREIAKVLGREGTLICIDLDETALIEAKQMLESMENPPTLHFVHSNFRYIKKILESFGINHISGIVADLGLSSQELDSSGRGFTFRYDEPLLMTFDEKPGDDMTTAYDILNYWSETTIADILFGFADERYAKRIAKKIVEYRAGRDIKTTFQLVDIIASAVPAQYRSRKIHFATKTFQALRMAANDELTSIKELIHDGASLLSPHGRICIITFHSTEDRTVKHLFREYKDVLYQITKKPIVPSAHEITMNPRARSAQLRIAEKISELY